MTRPAVLVCTGRPAGRPDRAACGATYQVGGAALPLLIESARVAGWRVGPATGATRPVMCPSCARPRRDDDCGTAPAVPQLETLPGL